MSEQQPPLHRVTPERPYVACWQAYGGHTMYVGALTGFQGEAYAGATSEVAEAAGFASAAEAASSVATWGYDGPWLRFEPYRGQLRLF